MPGVYCFCSSEPQANAILTALRNAGYGSEISVLLEHQSDTRNISLKENALRGAGIGSILGASLALIFTGVGPVLALGLFAGAAAGGAVGGLVGGAGGLEPLELPQVVHDRLHRLNDGAILISVQSADPHKLRRAAHFFRELGGEDIYEEPLEQAA
jgi:hypothetical protein